MFNKKTPRALLCILTNNWNGICRTEHRCSQWWFTEHKLQRCLNPWDCQRKPQTDEQKKQDRTEKLYLALVHSLTRMSSI